MPSPLRCQLQTHSLCKLVGLAAALLLLLASCTEQEALSHVNEHYPFNDGPWLSWCGPPDQTICVSWLSRRATSTRLELSQHAEGPFVLHEDPTPGHLHRLTLTQLLPESTYYYRVLRDDDLVGVAPIHSFRTLPRQPQRLRFVILGDMQPTNPEQIEALRRMLAAVWAEQPDFFVQLGDIVQRGDTPDHWHALLSNLPLLASTVPMVNVIGNHDRLGDGGSNWDALFPQPRPQSHDARYFAHSIGPLRLIMLDPYEQGAGFSTTQLDWLEAQLQAAREQSQFRLVFLHPAPLSTGTLNMDFELQAQLVPRFSRATVHGVFYGHDHMYEHFEYTYGAHGLFHDPADDKGERAVHYWLCGGGGAALEYDYGLLAQPIVNGSRRWFDATLSQWVDRAFWRGPWNEANVQLDAPEHSAPNGKNYFHDRNVQAYQSELEVYGHDYGETTLHYLLVTLQDGRLELSAHYPDGSLIDGPRATRPQHWQLDL